MSLPEQSLIPAALDVHDTAAADGLKASSPSLPSCWPALTPPSSAAKLPAIECGGEPSAGQLRVATAADLRFVDSLQKKYARALGFLPKPALEWYLEHGRVELVTENSDPAGYVLGLGHYRWFPRMRPITQAAVCMDAQRRHLGLSLVAKVVADAQAAGQIAVQAMCAEGLDANEFWRAAGFVLIGHTRPGNQRGRDILCWRKFLTRRIPPLLSALPPVSGMRARKTKLASHLTAAHKFGKLFSPNRADSRKESGE